MAPDKPGERVVETRPGQGTGDTLYVTENGWVYRSQDVVVERDPNDKGLFTPLYVRRR